MRRLWVALVAVALCACRSHVGPSSQTVRARAPSTPAVDRALELVAFLPLGSDRCVVTRTTLLQPAQRELFMRFSQADTLSFWPQLEVLGYAEAARERRDGAPFRVSLFWLPAAEPEVRAAFAARYRSRLAWDGETGECGPKGCTARARFEAPHVVRIEQGQAVLGASAGAEAHCAELAQRDPGALELSYARSRTLLSVTLGVVPLTVQSSVRAAQAGVHVHRVDLMRSGEDAEQVVDDASAADVLLGPLGALASGLKRQRDDAEVQTDYDLRWDDLAFAREAEARVHAAEQEAGALERAQLDAKLEPQNREQVIAALAQRLEHMRETSGDERMADAVAARELLERALVRDPDDEGLALLLTELYLTEFGAAEPARALTQRFLARRGARPRWPELQRHAAALLGEEALAAALQLAHLTDPRRARQVARDILTRLHEGAVYLEAERAVLGQQPR